MNRQSTGLNAWGPTYWAFFHSMASNYPKIPSQEEKMALLQFITILSKLLPCPMCQQHAQFYINQHASELLNIVETRENVIVFFWNFHNAVNMRLGKPVFPLNKLL